MPKDVRRAAHLILFDEFASSFMNKIINEPKSGKKITTLKIGQSNI